jgi:hypothetical protein
MSNDFTSLMRHGPQRKLMMSGEAARLHKSCRVGQEKISFSGSLEEIEGVVEKNAIFDVFMALDKQLLILPCHGAIVSELTERLLYKASVHVKAPPSADDALSFLFEVVVPAERLASIDVSLDIGQGTILNEPSGLGRVNLYKVVVDTLIEGGNMREVLLEGLDSGCQDRSDATELLL